MAASPAGQGWGRRWRARFIARSTTTRTAGRSAGSICRTRRIGCLGRDPIPIAVMKGGGPDRHSYRRQPRRRVRGADHDRRLIRELDPGRSGPADLPSRGERACRARRPAHLAGRRPEPQPRLSRHPEGTITQQIAYVNGRAFRAGRRLHRPAFGRVVPQDPAERDHRAGGRPGAEERIIAAVLAFERPLTVVIDNLGDPRTSTASSVRAGLTVSAPS